MAELQPGCKAAEAGLAVGDKVLKVDGLRIGCAADLAGAMQNKDLVEIVVSVERDGGGGGGDADGDGEIDEGEDGAAWVLPRRQVLLPLLSRGARPRHTLAVGSEVFAMVGRWREALVEMTPSAAPGRYQVHLDDSLTTP